jgi:hypothetical protein
MVSRFAPSATALLPVSPFQATTAALAGEIAAEPAAARRMAAVLKHRGIFEVPLTIEFRDGFTHRRRGTSAGR